MIWLMMFCAWSARSGGCITPVTLQTKRACEFALRHQTDVARQRDREWGSEGSMVITGRCVGVRP